MTDGTNIHTAAIRNRTHKTGGHAKSAMLKEAYFNRGKPIGPELDFEWPGERRVPLYWVARKTFNLDAAPDSAEILMAADRHYELFVNGRRVARQRGFFSGDEYIFAQQWTSGIAPLLRDGENTIDVVIRSDPWNNKNYRCFRPMLLLECETNNVVIATDDKWSIAIIEGWREQISIAGNRTINWERVNVSAADKAILCGVPNNLRFTPAHELDSVPRIYLWDDPPIRKEVRQPQRIVACGEYYLADNALSFDLSSTMEGEPLILKAEFEDAGGTEFHLATSALFEHRIEFNDQMICERSDVPSRHQMALPSYLVPAGWAVTKPGINTLTITILNRHPMNGEYRIAVYGLPTLSNPAIWNNQPEPKIVNLQIVERIGAKATRIEQYLVTVEGEQSSPNIHFQTSQGFTTLDFGQVISGRMSLKIHAESPGRIYLAHGFNLLNGAVDCNRMGLGMVDILELQPGDSSYESFDMRTFRYLDLLAEGFIGQVKISEIQVEEPIFLDENGSNIETSDPTIDAIFQASLRTAQLCGDELFVDNPEREHAQWMDGILYASSPGYYFFGERLAVKAAKAYQEIALTQQPDGQLAGYAPGAWFPRLPLQCHMALFVLGCHRHFMHTGDEDFARQMLEVILRMIAHWEKYRTRDGLIADLHTVFVDWGSHIYSYARRSEGPTGALTAMNAYYHGVLIRTVEMAKYLGQDKVASELRGIASEIRNSMIEHLYDRRIGLFRDGIGEPLAESNFSQTANILAVLHGAAPEGEAKVIMTRAFTPSDLQMIPANAFFALHAGAALFESGCDELALSQLRRFGRMIDEGPGTLWETWEPYASQCQSSGAAPAYLFARYLAGIYPAEPGYRAIGIDPHPADLDNLQATLSTPHGLINVRWTKTENGLDYRLDLPPILRKRPILKNPSVRILINGK